MSKYGVRVPRGAAASTVDEVKEIIRDVFPNNRDVIFLKI